MFSRLIAWSLANRLVILALTLVLFVAGGVVLERMPVDVFPEFAPPQVVIQTEAPGMAPQDVETLITYPLESAINGTPGVATVRSKSTVGLSTVVIVFEAGTDIYRARQLVGERLQGFQNGPPAGTKAPVMLPVTSAVGWLVKYALTSDTVSPLELRTIAEWEIRPRLLALGGIASVVSIGGEVKQYQARLDPARMLAYRVSADEVRQALEGSNSNVAGAFLERAGGEMVVTGVGRIASLDDVRDTLIVTRHGAPITIGNVATVGFGGEIKRGDGAFGMRNAVIGTVSKAYGADTLTTTYRVEAALAAIRDHLPAGVAMDAQVFRQAGFIEAAIHNLRIALVEGALIVVAVLFLFLMNWRASLITFLSMPASFVGGILVMHAFGIGINAMTLGGLAIAIGEVVDNGIITVENVVRRLRLDRGAARPTPRPALVLDAVQEILNSVVYATLIVVLIFLPIFFLEGLAGRIFSPLGVAYIASVMASLVVAVTMVPALCYFLLAHRAPGGDATAEHEPRFVLALKARFLTILRPALAHPRRVVGAALAALALALLLTLFLGRSFLPAFHEGSYIIAMTTLPGTSLEESMRLGAQVRKALLAHPQVVSIDQRAGRSELDEDAQPPNFSEFDVVLDFSKDDSMSPDELLARIRGDLDRFPGVVFNVGQFIAHRMDEVQSGVRAQVAVKVIGDDLATLHRIGQQVEAILRGVDGVVDVNLEQQIKVPQVIIRIDRRKAARYGIRAGALMQDIEMYLNGATVSRVLEGRRAFDLFVRLDQPARDSVAAIGNLMVDAPGLAAPGAGKVPLREVAEVTVEDQPYAINREDVQRLVVVGFNVQGANLGSAIATTQARVAAGVPLPPGYSIEYGGQFESQRQASRVLFGFGALAVFGAFVLLLKAFGSIGDALLVLGNLPLALIGGVFALFLAGAELSTAAVIGFITLFGIATRNGIILVTHYDRLRREGRPLEEVVVQGTLDRLVPVLMTAATAALGLIPLLWGSPVGKELERPLAQVVLGGLVTSTFLNLVVIPTVYNRLEQWRARRRMDERSVLQPTQ